MILCILTSVFQNIFSLEFLNHYPISACFHYNNFQEIGDSAVNRMISYSHPFLI